jgi:vanillate O-demethylase ferredoxin subunit
MAFRNRLAALQQSGQVAYHFDGGDPTKGIQLANVLAGYEAGTHLYYCGPLGLMQAIARNTAAWPGAAVHCEYFVAPAEVAVSAGAFNVKLASSGAVYTVPSGRSIVHVLRGAGIECTTSCEAGICGTCRTRYLAGAPEHHDFVLSEAERKEYLMICCARATSELLVLDL